MSRGGRNAGKRKDNGLSFSLEAMGLSRADTLPAPTLHPPPLYPTVDVKPTPLSTNQIDDYLLTLKQEFRQSLISSKYYINAEKGKPCIERYSDKYENIVNDNLNKSNQFEFDMKLFPIELCERKKRKITKQIDPNPGDLDKKLENLSQKEEIEDKTDDEKSNHELDENGTDDEKVEELEDVEEGTDYTFSYFDNGENYLDESDDNLDEGPTY